MNYSIEEKIKYSNLDDSFKDELYHLLDNKVDKELVRSELDESKFILDDGIFSFVKKLLEIGKKSKQNLIDDIEEVVIELEDIESNLQNQMEYHLEKIKEIQELLV